MSDSGVTFFIEVLTVGRRLYDMRIHEISLVDMPANKRKFAIIKRQMETQMDELKKMIEAFLGKELDEETVTKAKLAPEVQKMLEDQLTLIEKYRADLPVDVAVAIGTLSQHAAFGITKADEADKDTEDKAKDKGTKDDVTVESVIDGAVEKAVAKFSESNQKALDSTLVKLEEFSKTIADLKDVVDKSTTVEKVEDEDKEVDAETLQKMIDERVRRVEGK